MPISLSEEELSCKTPQRLRSKRATACKSLAHPQQQALDSTDGENSPAPGRQPSFPNTQPWGASPSDILSKRPPCSADCPSSHPLGSTHSNCPQLRLLASQPHTGDSHGVHLVPAQASTSSPWRFPNPCHTPPTWPIRVKILGVPDCHLEKEEGIPARWGKGHVLLSRVEGGVHTHGVKPVHSCSTNISEHWPWARPVQGARYTAVNKIRPGVPKGLRASPGVGRGDTVRLWNGLICAEKSISALLV